jgi:AcrR family transcriptional regulator
MSLDDINLPVMSLDVMRCGPLYNRCMSRWEPNASGRLSEAAMDLYVERGFEQTTVADIAARAGLTARTFFRHFADKREVIFGGTSALQDCIADAIEAAPASAAPMDVVAAALDAAATVLGGRRDYSRCRHQVIAAHPELQERELIKMASLSAVLADGLRRRGVADDDARLVAEAGIAVFRVAFDRWIEEPRDRELGTVMRESLDQLRALTAAGPRRG